MARRAGENAMWECGPGGLQIGRAKMSQNLGGISVRLSAKLRRN
jgi:hypothetical protein